MPDASGARRTESRPGSIRYIETGALLSALLEQNPGAMRELRAAGRRVTSALTVAESYRVVVRARVAGRLDADQARAVVLALRIFFARCDLVAVTDGVLLRAGRAFPEEPIRTLDAIHLASAEILGEPPPLVTIITRDAQLRENAQRLGYATA